jgi:hypothetical protein
MSTRDKSDIIAFALLLACLFIFISYRCEAGPAPVCAFDICF